MRVIWHFVSSTLLAAGIVVWDMCFMEPCQHYVRIILPVIIPWISKNHMRAYYAWFFLMTFFSLLP